MTIRLLEQLRELPLLVKDPKRYAAIRTVGTRQLFWHLFAALSPRERARRRRLALQLPARPDLPCVPVDQGFLKLECLDPQLVDRLVREARDILRSTDLARLEASSKAQHIMDVPINHRVTARSPIVDFALNPDLLRVVSDYLGMLPVIQHIAFIYSPNRQNVAGTSQQFHLDGQDVRMAQVWVYIEDVDEENGPLTVMNARESARLAHALKYRKHGDAKRVPDEAAYAVVEPASNVHRLTGKAGTVYLLDADRCFHFGSRQASRPRFVMDFSFVTPFAFTLPFDWKKGLPYASIPDKELLNEWERLVCGVD